MRKAQLLCLVGLLGVGMALSWNRSEASQPVPEIPPILNVNYPEGDYPYPSWVSLDVAFNSEGSLNREYFHEVDRVAIENFPYAEWDEAKGCFLLEEFYLSEVNPPDRSSLEKAALHSEAIVLATIQASEVGLASSTPGTLYLAGISRKLEGLEYTDQVYFFIPVAEFQVENRRYCKIDRRYPKPPGLGDEVLLLVQDVEDPAEPFVTVDGTSVIVFPRGQEVDLPEAFKSEGSAMGETATRDSILSEVQAVIRAKGSP